MTSKASAAVAFVALTLLTMDAQAQQGRGGGQRQAPSTTATPSTDPKKVSLNFTMSGMRFDYTPQGGQRTIEVVSDKFAWNEETPGGKATPMPAALQERQVQLVLTPIGMAKAAKAAGDQAKVSVAGGVTTLTFPSNGATRSEER